MSIKAYIDPNMFDLCEEDEIYSNINFFQQVISLCKQNRLNIVIYDVLLKKLKNRAIFPFPIDVSKLSNSLLKQIVLQLNENFYNSLANAWIPEDIDVCSGNQEFQSNPRMEDYYYELLSIMLSSCYKCGLKDANKVLIGNISGAQKRDFKLELSCSCQSTNFYEKYHWILPEDLLSLKDKQLLELKKLKFEKCENPELNRGDHHAPFMPRNVSLKKYSDIPHNSRCVLNILCHFGLSSVTLKDFHNDSSVLQGTIVISTYKQNETNDIIYGNLYLPRGFYSAVELTFPRGVGVCIALYCDKKIDYKTIVELATSLAII